MADKDPVLCIIEYNNQVLGEMLGAFDEIVKHVVENNADSTLFALDDLMELKFKIMNLVRDNNIAASRVKR